MELLRKMRGAGEAPPPRSPWAAILATAGAAAGLVAGLMFLTGEWGVLLLLGSFAPSALIVFAYPDSPFAQPRNVVLGHLIGSASGLAAAHLLPGHGWAAALAVGVAIGLMKAARAVHPPACSNPLIVGALLAGNAVAVHDIEAAVVGTTLGMTSGGAPTEGGHSAHMRAINAVRRSGSIEEAERHLNNFVLHALNTGKR
ncbi:hypothetical protein EBR16_01175, partial [bacterium]|nr:hypothetical protein [bacterium]